MFLKISKIFLYASVLCVTIVVTDSFFPFIGGKYDFFRAATELSLVALLVFWAWEDKEGLVADRWRALRKKPLFLAVTAFVFLYLLSALFAYDLHAAFWSNYERGEGAFQMLHYYLFFVLLGLVFSSGEDWKWLFRVSVVAAAAMILYGIAAAGFVSGFVGPYTDTIGKPAGATLWSRLVPSGVRFQGSLGNPAYVAPYLMFAIFYALYLWVSRKRASSWPAIAGYSTLTVFFLFFFWLSGTRGAFLGLDVAVSVFLGVVVFRDSIPRFKRLLGITVLPSAALFLILFSTSGFLGALLIAAFFGFNVGILVALVCLAFSKDEFFRLSSRIILGLIAVAVGMYCIIFFRHLSAVYDLPGARVLQISVTDSTAQTRLWTWNSAWRGFLERPLFGWGPENFSTVFDKYFDPRHFIPTQASETWFDRAHSVVLDYLTENGILAFLAYGSIFVVFFTAFFRKGKELAPAASPSGRLRSEAVKEGLLFALPVGYLVQGLVLFDVLPIYLNVFLFLGFATFLLYPLHSPASHE